MSKKHSKIEQVDGSNDKESDMESLRDTVNNDSTTPMPEPPIFNLEEITKMMTDNIKIEDAIFKMIGE